MNRSRTSNWLPGYIALGVTWGSSFLLIEWGLLTLTPLGIAFLRGSIGGLTLLIYAKATSQKLPRRISELKHLAIVALLLNAIPGFLFGVGQSQVSSITAGILNATTPIMTVLVITLAFREQTINSNQWLGVILGFLGVLLVINIFAENGRSTPAGIFELLLATLCYGISFPYSKRFVSKLPYSSTSLAATQVCLSALLLSPFAAIFPLVKSDWEPRSILGILLLGAVGTGFAYIWNFRNVKLAGSAIASTVTYITPVVATLLGYVFLKERLEISQLLGGVLIIFSATLVQERIRLVKRGE